MSNKKDHRSDSGSMLPFVVVSILALCLVGACIFALVKVIGGQRELQYAVDSGSLNIAKQAAKSPGIELQSQDEFDNFKDLCDDNHQVTLRTYNGLVAQALLIGINAKKENTAAALRNARQVLELVQGDKGIGKRLHDALVPASQHRAAFDTLASPNSLKLISSATSATFTDANFSTAYMERGQSSNVAIDKSYLKDASLGLATAVVSSPSGSKSFKGYTPINLGRGLVYQFVALPDAQPHLVSHKDFETNKIPALSGRIPPNAFESRGGASGATQDRYAISCSISAGRHSEMSNPGGYIALINPKGFGGSGKLPPQHSLYTDELAAGIYLASDSSGKVVAFSLDSSALSAWAKYNANGQSGAIPPREDANGNPLIYSADGSPATSSDLSKIQAIASPTAGCNYMNVSGPKGVPVSPTCNRLLPAFKNAFPHDEPTRPGDSSELMSVEKFRDDVTAAFAAIASQHLDAATSESPTTCAEIHAQRGYSGLRIFDHNHIYTDASMAKVSTPGNVLQLLTQIGGGTDRVSSKVLPQLIERIRQIKPEATDHEINRLLSGTTLELDSVHWIYMTNSRTTRTLVCSVTPPSERATLVADGAPQQYSSGSYQTLRLLIDPINDNGWNHEWTYVTPSGSDSQTALYYVQNGAMMTDFAALPVGLGEDLAIFTPSTGYNGLEGVLEFRNQSHGDGTFCGAN